MQTTDQAHLQPRFKRRDFLKLLGAAGVTAVGGSLLSIYEPWIDYKARAAEIRKPLTEGSTMPPDLKELVRYATLAANAHNSQPWKFAILENGIDIHPDTSRRLQVVDPDQRELWISLGCALENLCIAARAVGYAPQITYPAADDFIHVELAADTAQIGEWYRAIPQRQNTRSVYSGQNILTRELDKIHAVATEPGVTFKVITQSSGMETALEYVNQGNLSQYANKLFLDELIDWLRFNKKEALSTRDGLYSRCTGNPEAPRWLGKLFVSATKPAQQADADAKKLRSSAGIVVIATEADDKAAWVRAGQVYERLALELTSLNIRSAFLNQPLEVPKLRSEFQSAVNLGEAKPQLLLRFGVAELMPISLRRPVEQVLI